MLRGTRSAQTWFTDSVSHVAQHTPDAETQEIAGAGHLGPLTAPEAVANELTGFFEKQATTL
ncbi:MAG: alpha/beta fold hydrolase [Actinomycetota bacterium]